MQQDYGDLTLDELELVEKQTMRMIVQALQQYSKEARDIFENTKAVVSSEVIVLAEDLTQYALEVAEVYPINRRYAGFIDYKRVRWLPTPYGLIPQVLLVDAKASTENTRDTLQQSQLPMDAEFLTKSGAIATLSAGVERHLEIESVDGGPLKAVTTTLLVHLYYKDRPGGVPPYRELKAIYVLALPHAVLKPRYNPNPRATFFGQGKHSPARSEEPRIRVYFDKLRSACPWRLQQLGYGPPNGFTSPVWRDLDTNGVEVDQSFLFLSR